MPLELELLLELELELLRLVMAITPSHLAQIRSVGTILSHLLSITLSMTLSKKETNT